MKLINTYSGLNCTYTLESANSAGEQRLIIKELTIVKKVCYRRVPTNKESAIQFTIETFNKKTNRTKVESFSLPESFCEQFLNHLKPAQ